MHDDRRIAPNGAVWVCGACGRHGKDRYTLGEASCVLHAILCEEGSVKTREDGTVYEVRAYRRKKL